MKKKFKLRYRIIILLAVFFGALYYFSGNYLVVRSFELSTDTTEMAEATLPNISLVVEDEEINRLYGYTSNLDWELNRETITPLGKDKSFVVRIEENEMTVRRLKYELFDVASGSLLDSGTISALTSEKENISEGKPVKTAKIKLNAELNEGTEYCVKITLVTSNSKRVYYYTRVKLYKNGHLSEKLDYVRWFRESALNKINQEAVEKNLETKSNADVSTFAHTDINSPWKMVSWDELQPQLIEELPPTITDFYEGTASVVLSYLVQMDAGSGMERYMVREAFRFLYTDIRTYLYNYERDVEAIYDAAHTSLSKDDLKLGITSDTEMEILTTKNYEYTAFVRNRELWSYDRAENTMLRVFSFREEETGLMELYDAHNVKLLTLNSNGDMDFLVYGYMNRGEYEGRVGIILYRYYRDENRIEEQMYIPVNTTYQLLKGEVNEFVYMNSFDVLYFTIYNTIYSYNLTTRALRQLATDVPPERVVFLKELKHVVWQNDVGNTAGDSITVLNLETGTTQQICAAEGEILRLLGKIDNNLVYGYAKKAELARNFDGTVTVPMYRVVIADLEGTVFKEYSQPGFYVTAAEFAENVIHLTRVKRADTVEPSYLAAAPDAIQNRKNSSTPSVHITGRVTELAKTEYYITFPGNVDIVELPEVQNAPFTVLSQDPTVRITPAENLPEQYMTYSFGRVVICSQDAVDAIHRANADENVGAVIDNTGKVIWERGVKASRTTINGIKPAVVAGRNGLQAALKLIFAYEGFDIDTSGVSFEQKSITDWMEQYLKVSALDLKGASLDEVLYYVYKKYPVIVLPGDDNVLLITGYDQSTVELMDPLRGTVQKMDKEEAEKLFEDSGNVFFTYID